jgi:hypothetical protein
MRIEKLSLNYWAVLDDYINKSYPDKTVFLYDENNSFFDVDEAIPSIDTRLYVFNTIVEYKEYIDSPICLCNIVTDLSALWVNGKRDMETIYELRG